MTTKTEFLWYIPNEVESGHRGDPQTPDHNSLDTLTEHAVALEQHGWRGALIGAGWGRPDTFTVATALTARTRSFEPLIAIRPGYWRPANFASSAATLDRLTQALAPHLGPIAKVLVNRAAKRVANLHDLQEALAAEISGPEDRRRFLTRVRSTL